MHWWPVYGAFTIGAYAVTHYGRRNRRSEDTLGAAFVLTLLWLLWNCSHWFAPHPYSQFFPILDAFTCLCMIWLWRDRLRPWKVALILLFAGECLLHVEYFMVGDRSHAAKYVYDLKQNLIYIGQWSCVSLYGAARIWRRWVA